MLRQIMIRDGVPPDQIEARLNAAVANAQKWLDNGMPNYVPPNPRARRRRDSARDSVTAGLRPSRGSKTSSGKEAPAHPASSSRGGGWLKGPLQKAEECATSPAGPSMTSRGKSKIS